MDEKKFNKIFSAFILIGMAVCVIVSCIFKMQEPGARTALLVISTFGALMGVVSVVLKFSGLNLRLETWNAGYGEAVAIIPFLALCAFMVFASMKKDK